jgi:DNA-binding transcriptional ArsR family regulator
MQAALDTTFAALSDPTRRAILARLARGGATVNELAKPFATSLPGITKHLGKLEQAGLIVSEKKGRERHCRLAARPLKDAADWLSHYEQFWTSQFDRLAKHLESKESKEGAKK